MLFAKLMRKMARPLAGSPANKEIGLSIVEILIAVGIMGFVIGSVSTFVPKIFSNQDRIESISVRDGLATALKRSATTTNLIYSANALANATYPGNIALRDCIDGNPTTICRSTDRNNPVDFVLAYQRGNSPMIVAGTLTAPALYQKRGGLCAQLVNCDVDWSITAYFSAVCPDNAPNCTDADSVRFRYQIKHVPKKGERPIPSLPSDDEFQDSSRAFIMIPIFKDFRGGGCPALSIVASILPTGAPVCTCQPGTIKLQTLPNGQPDCRPSSPGQCNNLKQRLRGFDINMNPICIDRDMQCTIIPTTGYCNGWIRSVNLGTCRVITSSTAKGGQKKQAVCDANQHECCRPI